MDTQTPAKSDDIRHEAAGNLAFLLSVIRCGEQLSEAEEANIRRVIRCLNESTIAPSELAAPPQRSEEARRQQPKSEMEPIE